MKLFVGFGLTVLKNNISVYMVSRFLMPLWYVTQHNRPTPPTFLIEVNFKSVRMRSQVQDNNMHLKFKLRSILSPFEHVSGALSESMHIQ